MAILSPLRWYFLLLSMLLASCTDPKAFRITEHENWHNATMTGINYSVFNLDPTNQAQWQQLNYKADMAVDDEQIGRVTVSFFDGVTDNLILRITYEVAFEEILLHSKRISSYDCGPGYEQYAIPGL